MPAYDRYWRLGVAALLLLALLAAGLFAWYLVTGGSLERLLGSGITYTNTCQAIWIVLVLLTVVSHLAAARKRERARHAALRGDLSAMPPSRIALPDEQPTVAELRTPRSVVSADDAGLHFHRIGTRRHDVSVPWGEARLLEVWRTGTGRQGRRGFTLYGERARIEWSLPRDPQMRLQKQSDAEAVLLAAIHTRTGLIPRTLAPALRAPDTLPSEHTGPKLVGTIVVIVLALAPFALAAAALLLPLTTVLWLNAYVALTFVVVGLLMATATVQTLGELFRRTPLPDPGTILPPGMPPPDMMSGTGAYELRWRKRSLTWLGEASLGALFAGNAIPLIGILSGAEAAVAGDLMVILNLAVGGVAVLGLALLLDSAIGVHHTVRANAMGLTAGRQTLRWSDVEEVVAHAPRRAVEEFKVVGGEGDVTIEWPAKVRAKPRPGAQPITPGELAALVVARSGKALRVEE